LAWFRYWITEGFSIRQLQYFNKHSSSKIRRIINRYLSITPTNKSHSLSLHRNLIFDGTYLHHRTSVIVLMSAEKHTVIAGQYEISENSQPQLRSFFEPLKSKSLSPRSCTVDGNPHVIKTLKTLWPDIIIQRCLVHIQRQGLMWCRQNPQRFDAKELRYIFLHVPYIKSYEQRDALLQEIHKWELRWGIFIDAQPEHGKVFSDLKRARSMLLKAIPDMFHYLDDPSIPPTTNGLEGYFARLKQRYCQHRGLTPSKRHNYFQWYFNLCPH
jgi:hypothetical protein